MIYEFLKTDLNMGGQLLKGVSGPEDISVEHWDYSRKA